MPPNFVVTKFHNQLFYRKNKTMFNTLAKSLIPVVDLADKRMDGYASQRDHAIRARGEIIVDSHKVVMRLIACKTQLVKSILASTNFYKQNADMIANGLDLNETKLFVAEPDILGAIAGHKIHQGVIAIARRPEDCELAELVSPIVVLNGVNDAENVGAIIRSCLAFGFGSILVDQSSCSPWVRRAIRVSMGSVFYMRTRHTTTLFEDLTQLKSLGFAIYAASNDACSVNLFEIRGPQKPVAIVIGSEGFGIEREIKDISDVVVRIPIAASVDSLNASVAGGIILYQLAGGRRGDAPIFPENGQQKTPL